MLTDKRRYQLTSYLETPMTRLDKNLFGFFTASLHLPNESLGFHWQNVPKASNNSVRYCFRLRGDVDEQNLTSTST